LQIRLLKTGDLPDLAALSAGAGWNQTTEDWEMLLALAPDTCLGVECEGCLAATTTLLCYGTRLAWVGMVLTAPTFQRRGFARALVTRALELARERQIETVKLDATDQGRPLYESLGFVSERAIERWFCGDIETSHKKVPRHDLQGVLEIDRGAFPADRSAVLGALRKRSREFGVQNGYLLCRAGRRATYIGPFICHQRSAAEELLALGLASGGKSFLWDLFPGNEAALELARQRGFQRERALTRMSWGRELHETIEPVYGIAGFELG
jgi:GNAT superfamily N-acetyltransferase